MSTEQERQAEQDGCDIPSSPQWRLTFVASVCVDGKLDNARADLLKRLEASGLDWVEWKDVEQI